MQDLAVGGLGNLCMAAWIEANDWHTGLDLWAPCLDTLLPLPRMAAQYPGSRHGIASQHYIC